MEPVGALGAALGNRGETEAPGRPGRKPTGRPPPPHLGVSLQNGSKRAQWCLAPLLPQLRLLSSYAPGDGGERNKLGLALGARPAGKIGIS